MKAIFWDRRNRRKVSSNELMKINLTEEGWTELKIGEFGYKSEDCPDYCNWDLYCLSEDLVFLELEEM